MEKTKRIEIEAIKIAESGKLEQGLQLINTAIEIMPNRPSLYNNRAHIYQFKRQFQGKHIATDKTSF